MAGIKISALPAIPSSQLTDIAPYTQGTITYKATLSQVTTLLNANIVLSSTAQVTGLPAALAGLLPLSGGTMTGVINMGNHNITNLTNPVNPQDAATMAYVQTFASGFTVVLSCAAATTANLNATPAGAGIGATLTNAGAMAAFAVDGYSASLNDRILVKNQTLSQHNGIYSVTTVGSGAANWVLTRTTDYDTAAQIKPGTLVAVNNGTVNATTSWIETATVVTVDTDPISFSQFSFGPATFFQIANNLSEGNAATMRTNLGLSGAATMSLPVSGANGGTGVANTGSTITIGGNVTFSGAFTTALTVIGNTALTLPTTGTLITSSQPTINQPNIVGTTTNDNAAAGSVGEFVSSVVANGSALSLSNNVAKNITSISLTAGDWNIWGNVMTNTSPSQTSLFAWTSATSATQPDASLCALASSSGGIGSSGLSVPQRRYSLSVTTTIYLSCVSTFGGSVTASGGIYARRVR